MYMNNYLLYISMFDNMANDALHIANPPSSSNNFTNGGDDSGGGNFFGGGDFTGGCGGDFTGGGGGDSGAF